MNIKLFIISCRTGCSCCSYENYHIGPFTEENAKRRLAYLNDGHGLLASQYSKNGHYKIYECDAEILDDGRAIIHNCVFTPDRIGLKTPGPNGEPPDKEWFCGQDIE
jgi:hypothetical protein